MSPHHRHRTSNSRTVGWTHCILDGACDGAAHGGVVHIDSCRCGAVRRTERNGRHIRRSGWGPPPTTYDVVDPSLGPLQVNIWTLAAARRSLAQARDRGLCARIVELSCAGRRWVGEEEEE